MPSSAAAGQEALLSNFGFSWKPVMFLLGRRCRVRLDFFLLCSGLGRWGGDGAVDKWRSDFGRRWKSLQKVFNSQKDFCCGEKEGHSPMEQHAGDSRGGTRPGLLTCGFNYPVSHWFTVIQV